jgi:molybdate transport system substrate-binding protein
MRLLGFALALVSSPIAIARGQRPPVEVRVWTARALATVLQEIGFQFERSAGVKLHVTSDLPGEFARRRSVGERFDVLITVSTVLDEWIKEGAVLAGTRSDISRSGIGVEVRAGAARPDISSVESFRQALLDAKSIAFLRVGSGIHMAGLLERLGIASAVSPKVVRPETDIVSEMVARGEVEIGIVVITQILTTPGVELVGPLPAELQSHIGFSAGVSSTSRSPGLARQLIEFLGTPEAIRVIRAQGMDPAPFSVR